MLFKTPETRSLIFRFVINSVILLGLYGVYLGCDQKGKDLKKELFDRKIISLSEEIELGKDGSNPLDNDPAAIDNGKGHFLALCAVCHGRDARGVTGPDLMDDVWLHGEDSFSVYGILMQGISIDRMKLIPPKGKMPGYRDILGSRKVLEIMAYLKKQRESASGVSKEK